MIVWLNGNFVPEAEACVSIFDRGFLYGDGLFETIRVFNGRPFRWEEHLHRWQSGAAFLGISLPNTVHSLRTLADQLITRNAMPDSLLRLTISRGVGRRGYSPKGAEYPSIVMSLHPSPWLQAEAPLRWRLVISSFRLPANEPLAQFKTCNKLPQILARAEADAKGADEALLLNTNGEVVEAPSANLFWVENQAVCTPPLASGILPGVTRGVVIEICRDLGLVVRETRIAPEQLKQVEGLFLSLSSVGIAEATSLDGQQLPQSPIVSQIRADYLTLLERETGAGQPHRVNPGGISA